jgi:poly-gamma-glutamate synthesis protein (capsule biosynthesis protein)
MWKWWRGFLLLGVFGVGLGAGVGILGRGIKLSIINNQSSNNQARDGVLSIKTDEVMPSPTPPACIFTMAAVGDVMLGRSVMEQMQRRGDWTWPFASTFAVLAAADITVGNLEAPIVSGCYQKENRFILCTGPEATIGLKSAGFDVLSLANNHMFNWGQEGFGQTVTALEGEGMEGVADELVGFEEACGTTVAFMGLDDVTQPLDLDVVAERARNVASNSGVTVALVHWGVEYEDQPRPRQREVARALVDSGVDVILGAHPHWVQPAEYVDQTLVFWSLGNFVFDQMWSDATRQGEIAEVRFKIQDARIIAVDYELISTKIYDYGQPRIETSNQ